MNDDGLQVRIMLQEPPDDDAASRERYTELAALNNALNQLRKIDARKAKVVELRYFAGFSTEEVAKSLGVSEDVALIDWGMARRWLRREMFKSESAIQYEAEEKKTPRPPFNAEYILYLVLRAHEREEILGDLTEAYGQLYKRFNKRRADLWFYKQVAGSLWPLFRRAVVKVSAFVWLGRILRRLIS